MIRRLWCFLGFHDWSYDWLDTENYTDIERTCKHCGLKEIDE